MQVAEAVDSLYSEFRAMDNLVAHNTTRVLKAFQNARVGSHVIFFCVVLFGYNVRDGYRIYTWMPIFFSVIL